ncbi:hypothetical protein SLS57_003029 [Botryosphaeria dothidea]
MPRKLPWLKDAPEKPEPRVTERSAKRQRLLSPDLPDDPKSPAASTPRRKAKVRTADDVWMMVEDEFLDTARLFTQHLHHAEYHRLKRLAREKNASALQNISRPVVARGKMSIEAQKKHEARARAERQVEALRNIEGADNDVEELEDEAPWARDPHLGGLMSGSQDSTSQLSTIAGIKSKTRAAAGYGGTTSKLPLGKIDASKVSSAHTSKSSIAGLAKEIRRAAASSDEEDLDRYSSSSKPAKQVSHRPEFSGIVHKAQAYNKCRKWFKHGELVKVNKTEAANLKIYFIQHLSRA